MKYRFIQTDVFTNEPFTGNALAVFPEAEGLTDEQMMKIAREMNLSETVFVLKPEEKQTADSKQQSAEPASEDTAEPEGASDKAGKAEVLRRLRILTPAREIPFAGHPVVGTWNVLAREGIVPLPENGTGWTRIRSLAGLGRCRVNSSLLADVYQRAGATGCSVVSRETIEIGAARAHTRMFAPGDNIAEDPATGSAAGALGAYLVHHGAQNVDPVKVNNSGRYKPCPYN